MTSSISSTTSIGTIQFNERKSAFKRPKDWTAFEQRVNEIVQCIPQATPTSSPTPPSSPSPSLVSPSPVPVIGMPIVLGSSEILFGPLMGSRDESEDECVLYRLNPTPSSSPAPVGEASEKMADDIDEGAEIECASQSSTPPPPPPSPAGASGRVADSKQSEVGEGTLNLSKTAR